MRLTPFRKNSSSDSSGDESTVQASTSVRVLEYNESSIVSEDRETDTTTGAPVELEWNVVSLLESRNGPVTIDEIADQLYDASGTDDVEAWGDVHERLSQTDLPALDASGVIEYRPERGTVRLADNHSTGRWHYPLAFVFAVSLALLVSPIVFEITAAVSVVGLLAACIGAVATIYR